MLKLTMIVSALLVMLLPTSSGQSGRVRFCGRMLAQSLSLLCEGRYHGPADNRLGKRDVPQQAVGPLSSWILDMSSQGTGEFKPPQAPSRPRQQRGVVDECCRNPCSPNVLLSYCGSSK